MTRVTLIQENRELPQKAAPCISPSQSMLRDQPYHVKYRPKVLEEMVGHNETIKSLRKVLTSSAAPHAFLFTGPSGTGKTTLARIIASHLGCAPHNTIETDAATNTGIDAMRAITDTLKYQGFGPNSRKMVILDEVHALSKAAWQAILKVLEEPPPHVYFALCTTDPAKVPETVVTRCHAYTLRPVRSDYIGDLLDHVIKSEALTVPSEFVSLVARAASGSPRRALVMLSMIRSAETLQEVQQILETPLEDSDVIELCRMIVNGRGLTWAWVQDFFVRHSEQSPESVRITIINYLNSCLLRAKEHEAPRLLDILYLFSKPMNPSDKVAPLLLALGEILFPPNK